jgi:hypothetical protein
MFVCETCAPPSLRWTFRIGGLSRGPCELCRNSGICKDIHHDLIADHLAAREKPVLETIFADQPADPSNLALLATVERLVRSKGEGNEVVVQVRRDGEGHGLVLYRRSGYQPYVVHRWGTLDKSGQPIGDGGILYSGQYFDTYEEAVEDFSTARRER